MPKSSTLNITQLPGTAIRPRRFRRLQRNADFHFFSRASEWNRNTIRRIQFFAIKESQLVAAFPNRCSSVLNFPFLQKCCIRLHRHRIRKGNILDQASIIKHSGAGNNDFGPDHHFEKIAATIFWLPITSKSPCTGWGGHIHRHRYLFAWSCVWQRHRSRSAELVSAKESQYAVRAPRNCSRTAQSPGFDKGSARLKTGAIGYSFIGNKHRFAHSGGYVPKQWQWIDNIRDNITAQSMANPL